MIITVISFALVKFYAFAILYVLIVMQIKLVVVFASEYTYMKSLDRLLVTHVYIFRLREADALVTVKLVKPLLCQIIVFSFTGKLSKVITSY